MDSDSSMKPRLGGFRSILYLFLILILAGGAFLTYRVAFYNAPETNELLCTEKGDCPDPLFADVAIEICGNDLIYPRETISSANVEMTEQQNVGDFFTMIGSNFNGTCLGDTCNGDICRGKPGAFKMWVNEREVASFDEYAIAEEDVITISFQETDSNKVPDSVAREYTGPYYVYEFSDKQENREVAGQQEYTLNSSESRMTWKASSLALDHEGTIAISSGQAKIDTLNKTLVSGDFVIDMKSFDETTLDAEMKEQFMTHISGPDFFDMEKYPEATLHLTEAKALDNEQKFELTGNLTIKGVTKRISFEADVYQDENGNLRANADFAIDRTRWDITYGSSDFFDNLGDRAIRNEIQFEISLVLMEM